MPHIPHPRLRLHVGEEAAAPLALATVVVGALLLAAIAALVGALPA